jgi:hypothetical protein
VEGQGDDVACIGSGGGMAGCPGGDALLPTQDEKNKIPDGVLDNGYSVARSVVDVLDRRIAIGLKNIIQVSTQLSKETAQGVRSNTKRLVQVHRYHVVIPSFWPSSRPYPSTWMPSWIHARMQSSSSSPWCPRPGSPLALQKRKALAASQRRSKPVCRFTSLLPERVVGNSASDTAESLLQVLDVFLIGGGHLVDLVWRVSVLQVMMTSLG